MLYHVLLLFSLWWFRVFIHFCRRFLRAAQVSFPVMCFSFIRSDISIAHKTCSRKIETLLVICLQNQSLEMEFLANYLTELTLMDYPFLKFLPSIIAASAVFLAKWTLNQSSHPWVCNWPTIFFIKKHSESWISLLFTLFYEQNPTLEHYTTYKASDLKASVHALQDLQLNTKGCSLNSIRMKYRQDKVLKNY